MLDTEKICKRGRPRAFDREAALATASTLFHAHGYEGVGVAALADAILSLPEPGTGLLLCLGFGALSIRPPRRTRGG